MENSPERSQIRQRLAEKHSSLLQVEKQSLAFPVCINKLFQQYAQQPTVTGTGAALTRLLKSRCV